MSDPHRDEIHIASFVIQHRAEAAALLAEHIASSPDLELARTESIRSIVLCECANQYAIVDLIDTLRALPGVLNVSLVYHHAEPRAALDEPLPTFDPAGAAP